MNRLLKVNNVRDIVQKLDGFALPCETLHPLRLWCLLEARQQLGGELVARDGDGTTDAVTFSELAEFIDLINRLEKELES